MDSRTTLSVAERLRTVVRLVAVGNSDSAECFSARSCEDVQCGNALVRKSGVVCGSGTRTGKEFAQPRGLRYYCGCCPAVEGTTSVTSVYSRSFRRTMVLCFRLLSRHY